MKKLCKILVFILSLVLILPFSTVITGCSSSKITVNFYDQNLNIISTKQYDNNLDNNKIEVPNLPNITGFTKLGWHVTGYGNIQDVLISQSIWDFNDDTVFAGDVINFVADYQISNSGWHYVEEENGDNLNAFKWTNSTYTSPAFQLVAGENYLRFDKTTTEHALKYCKVFENGSDNLGHIQSVELLDNNACNIADIDLSANIWENQTLQANKTGSYVIKIVITKAIEVGLLVGEVIS